MDGNEKELPVAPSPLKTEKNYKKCNPSEHQTSYFPQLHHCTRTVKDTMVVDTGRPPSIKDQ